MQTEIYYAAIPVLRAIDGTLRYDEVQEVESYYAATLRARAAVGTTSSRDRVVGAVAVSRVRTVDAEDELTLVLTRFGEATSLDEALPRKRETNIV